MTNSISKVSEDSGNKLLSIKGRINKADIAAIGIADIEGRLAKAEKGFLDSLKASADKIAAANKELSKHVDAVTSKALEQDVDNFNKAYLNLGGQEIRGNKHTKPCKITCSRLEVDTKTGEKKVVAEVSLLWNSHVVYREFSVNSSINKAHAELVGLQKEDNELRIRLMDVREKMTQLPRLERQLKANIAKSELENSESGQKIIQVIEDSAAEFMANI